MRARQYTDNLIDRGRDLMISVSGIRGRIPAGLDTINIVHFARAFAAMTGNKIVIGNDGRSTGPVLHHLTTGVLIAAGKEILDIGLAPTPTVKAAVRLFKAHGGIMFSASHNPPDWNAFKFINKSGLFFNQRQSDKLLETLQKNEFPAKNYNEMGSIQELDGISAHIDTILDSIPNREKIKSRKYHVVVDAVAGAGRKALPLLLRNLNCQVTELNCDPMPSGKFPRPPEPTPAALKKFSNLVREKRADIGFALDPDADRLIIATPGKGALNEEYTLPIALMGHKKYQGTKKIKGSIVVNLSTSRLIDHVANRRNISVFRTAVGEANVVEGMLKKKAIFGGEGNGGIIDPQIPSFGRDALAGAALTLSALSNNDCTIDELHEDIPPLFMQKIKLPIKDSTKDSKSKIRQHFLQLERSFPDAQLRKDDGLHLQLNNQSWLHLRKSNTEPIIRLIIQAESKKRLNELVELVTHLITTSVRPVKK